MVLNPDQNMNAFTELFYETVRAFGLFTIPVWTYITIVTSAELRGSPTLVYSRCSEALVSFVSQTSRSLQRFALYSLGFALS